MPEINELYDKYNDVCDFAMIYIAEAHAEDRWVINSKIKINEHVMLEERRIAALRLKNETGFKLPIYLDNMDDEFESVFKGWPFRTYIFRDNKIFFKGMPKDGTFSLEELEEQINRAINI